ncbi:MAG TPA: DUF3052 family protein [Polyangiaceae bacterium]|jgi:hypothetical protein|nr:DUF3052 family protein [Polyangiaceae bacterium]
MAGYSGTPLSQKLGLKASARLGLMGAPKAFAQTLGTLPAGVTTSDATRGSSPLDVLVCFASSRAELSRMLSKAHKRLHPNGGLWICWRKKASGVVTDVTENDVRNAGLAAGLVDNKVCAVDEVWSGLRLVVRLQNRPKAGGTARTPRPKTSKKTAKRSG